jgi:phage tail-like protein
MSEPEGRGAAWTDVPKGRGAAWTKERGARNERRATREGGALSAPEAQSKQGGALSAPEAHRKQSTSAAYRVSGPVPALFHEDPLFLGLCAAFDELLGPVVTALDCFAAYLDPWLAPDDFLAWLGTLVGVGVGVGADIGVDVGAEADASGRQRALIAGAVRAYRVRGTAAGLRDVVATAAHVPAEQVSVAESGSVTWSDRPGAAIAPPLHPVVTITVVVPAGRDPASVAACARSAAEPALSVFSQLRIEVVES